MANEWTKIELYGQNNDGEQRRYTVADGLSVSKGQLLALAASRTAVAMTYGAMVSGVAAEEKIANDGTTSISCWTSGIFNAVSSGGIRVGDAVVGSSNNLVVSGAGLSVVSGALCLGYAVDTFAAGEIKQVRLRL